MSLSRSCLSNRTMNGKISSLVEQHGTVGALRPSAVARVGQAVNLAVERFVTVGEAIADDYPEVRQGMYEACKEARQAGEATVCIKCNSEIKEDCDNSKQTAKCDGNCVAYSSYKQKTKKQFVPSYIKDCVKHSTPSRPGGCDYMLKKVNPPGPCHCTLCSSDKCNAGKMEKAVEG